MTSSALRFGNGAALALIASLLATAALAQPRAGESDAVRAARAGVAELGKQWSQDANAKTAKLYRALHRAVDSSGIRQISGLSYGAHRQQTLDLCVPDQDFDEPGPVLVYLHGGGSTGGDKIVADTDGLIYANVGKWIARVGGVGISANYRLLPEAKWPSGADDIRLLLDWVRKNVGSYGGDPNTVILMGNSVGAMHVASYLFYEPAQLDGDPASRQPS